MGAPHDWAMTYMHVCICRCQEFELIPLIQLIIIHWCLTIQYDYVLLGSWTFDSNCPSLKYGAEGGSAREAAAGGDLGKRVAKQVGFGDLTLRMNLLKDSHYFLVGGLLGA